jgi:PelA/Pel-15E family pectate lyase
MRNCSSWIAFAVVCLVPPASAQVTDAQLHAKVVGVSQPAPSLTEVRIHQLPPAKRGPWMSYLLRSSAQEQVDRAALAAERKGLAAIPPRPPEGGFRNSMPLDRDAAWYAGPEARHIADVIVSFQTPGGGWSKNMSMAGEPRQRGQSYAPDNVSKYLGPDDFDTPRAREWNYISTLDNNATTTEMRFLARVATANPGAAGKPYGDSFIRGIHYLLNAQYPNGGWPQVWPLEGGYHDAVTFNDNAVTQAAEVLTDAANGAGDYGLVPADLRTLARVSAARALDCILAAQIVVNGKRTAWAQQHDPITLAPVSGRNFEPAALSSGESADLLVYLMSLPNPSPAVHAAINYGIAWLKSTAIYGQQWTGTRAEGRHLVATPGAGPIWARYYSITTGQPIFGDRDKTIHDDVSELSLERRNGYQWFSNGPQHALDVNAEWNKIHPLTEQDGKR